MNNHAYIIACLPILSQDAARLERIDADEIIAEIRDGLDTSERAVLDFMLKGYDSDTLGPEFYKSAMAHRNRFIREYFGFDMDLRNAKVHYLNAALGRETGLDVMILGEEERAFERKDEAEAVLNGTDILARERGLDDMMWSKAEELTELEVFSLDAILGFVARLKIIDRWIKLDPETGRAMFRRLVDEIRNNRQ